ncbi:hypothetical protein BO71DRAFT_312525 [Aspergillus ellipticus CBS 707.79]|uniref:Cell wall protein n=1 Tax=Aspergillus ellipticus CBS 707.79 TaxID=1448320 RepID=A0A319E166_9EURO|nr:hypothetical protein BO71DRAFT_312525 [Aspergillus ellipticus CBS 707.79]
MHLPRLLLLPVFLALGIHAAPADDVTPARQALINDYIKTIDDSRAALQAYKGGHLGVLPMYLALTSTRQTANSISDSLAKSGPYSPADSAACANTTLTAGADMVDALNVAQVKLPLIQKAGYGSIARRTVTT